MIIIIHTKTRIFFIYFFLLKHICFRLRLLQMVTKLSQVTFWIFYKRNIAAHFLVKSISDRLSCEFFFVYFTTDVVTNFASVIHFSISSIECGLFYRYFFFKKWRLSTGHTVREFNIHVLHYPELMRMF